MSETFKKMMREIHGDDWETKVKNILDEPIPFPEDAGKYCGCCGRNSNEINERISTNTQYEG